MEDERALAVNAIAIGQQVQDGLASLQRDQASDYEAHFDRLQRAASDAAALQVLEEPARFLPVRHFAEVVDGNAT